MAKKYRKKPVVIEAMKWSGAAESATPIIEWALDGGATITYHCPDEVSCAAEVHMLRVLTLEGPMLASPGDWIIRGVGGEFYPYKPDIFAKTYDEVSDDEG